MYGKKALWVAGILIVVSVTAVIFAVNRRGGLPAANVNAPSGQPLNVIATFFPLYDFARRVGGDRITVDILFGQTPEVTSLTPADVRKLEAADVVIMNGAGLEPILDDLIAARSSAGLTVVDTSRGVTMLPVAEPERLESEGEGEDEHAGIDPHIWLDPRFAIIQVGNIRDALAARDPHNASDYQQNASALIRDLEQLDAEITSAVARLPRRDFVAFHGAFQYFARRYGLNQVAVIEEFPGKEPTPRYLAEVIRVIREKNVRAIFSEPQFSPRLVETVARDLGLTIHELDPIETGDLARDSYLSLMRKNLATLEAALR